MNPNVDKLLVPDAGVAVNSDGSPAYNGNISPIPTSPERLIPSELQPPATPMVSQQSVSPLLDPLATLPTQQLATGQGQTATEIQADRDDPSIEKECISRAKAIVRRTSADPFIQSKEISKVKAELLKRRYGKELKTSGG